MAEKRTANLEDLFTEIEEILNHMESSEISLEDSSGYMKQV